MAYISTEEVKEIRAKIKKEFTTKDGWKFSITRRHSTTVVVSIMEAPIDLIECSEYVRNNYYQVNTFYIDSTYSEFDEARKALKKISDIVEACKAYEDRNAGDMGADYGDSNYFFDLEVGKWNKPFIQSK